MLLFSLMFGGQIVRRAEANFFPIPIPQPAFVIRSEGSVEPSTAPIQRVGDIYTFTGDIVGYTIAIERDNIILDGGGYKLQGTGNSTGVFLKNRSGVTVRNMEISGFTYAIRLFAEDFMGMTSANNNLSGNIVTDNEYGIYISFSSNNTLRNNRMSNNTYNFWIRGGYISESQSGYINDIAPSNTVDEKPIIYWLNEQDKTVPSDAGYVALINCNNIMVQNLDLVNNGHGILLVSTTNTQITKNHITNTGNGIYVYDSSNIIITENNLANNNNGISGYSSSNNNISSNNITENDNGIYFTFSSENNLISGNRVTENTVDGIHLQGIRNTIIEENTITNNNETGINFFESPNNKITENTITSNGHGVKFWYDSNENTLSENYVTNNSIGIIIDSSFDNKVIQNMITENNGWAIRLEGSQNNNVIYHNSFINNKVEEGLQVSIPGVWSIEGMKPGGGNVWDNGTTGNYWSDYGTRYPNATEIDGSGIGDTPFYINENNIDRYPTMEPIIIPEFLAWTPITVTLVMLAIALAVYKQKLHKPKDERI